MERGDQKSSLQSPLILSNERGHEFDGETSQRQSICSRANVIEEATKQIWLAGPLIAVSLLQYCLQVISIMFVGHLGELALSSASIASSFASVSGFSVLVSGAFLFLFKNLLEIGVFAVIMSLISLAKYLGICKFWILIIRGYDI